jgi:GYD domain
MGVSIKPMYWTFGHYDQVCVFEAPDDEKAASVLLAANTLGNIRTQTSMLLRPPRWRRSWPRCPDPAVVRPTAKRGPCRVAPPQPVQVARPIRIWYQLSSTVHREIKTIS